jgi:hypothetical protein
MNLDLSVKITEWRKQGQKDRRGTGIEGHAGGPLPFVFSRFKFKRLREAPGLREVLRECPI